MHLFIDSHGVILASIALLYFYQMAYIAVVFAHDIWEKMTGRKKPETVVTEHRIAAIICARNESSVIGQLLDTINDQTYPEALRHAVVIADNCTDDTAEIAAKHGATVFERFSTTQVGKGYALNYAFSRIAEKFGADYFDAYLIIDADNLLEKNYFAEMNKTYCEGYRVITSYRNSKNFGANWISAGYAVAFLREAKFLNNARMMLGSSCAVSGTGFLVASEIIRERKGWKYHLLTEDIEFTVDTIIGGERIGYCGAAMLYDEQPTTFRQSWNQRLRWSRGFYQIVAKYGKRMLGSVAHNRTGNRFSCYDITMTVMPTMLLTIAILLSELGLLAYSVFGPIFMPHLMHLMTNSLLWWVKTYYSSLFFMGAVTVLSEWKKIRCPLYKRVLYTFTYPLFMMTYIPISIAAMFGRVEWKPIHHSVAKTLDEVR